MELEQIETFDKMGLKENLLRGIYSYGFEKPSEIQQKVIVPIIQGHDTIAQAASGTGKTGAFTIAALERIDFGKETCQVIILSPTRELAQQTYHVMKAIGEYLSADSCCKLAIGGTKIALDIQELRFKHPRSLVGTPGRVLDFLNRKLIKVDDVKLFILDEADELLSQGFTDQIYDSFRLLPKTTQVALFSATMPPEVLEISKKFMNNPVKELVRKEELSLKGIKQFYIAMEEKDKFETLCDLYELVTIAQSIIFCNTKKKAIWLAEEMEKKFFTVSLIHSDMTKDERNRIIEIFRNGSSRVLIATDIIARGLDVHHVNIVINYDIPLDRENYLHRIGRAGRYGRKGITMNMVTPKDKPLITDLEKYYDMVVEELPESFGTYLE